MTDQEIRDKWKEVIHSNAQPGCVKDSGAWVIEVVRWAEAAAAHRAPGDAGGMTALRVLRDAAELKRKTWERLGKCQDEFPDDPGACSECVEQDDEAQIELNATLDLFAATPAPAPSESVVRAAQTYVNATRNLNKLEELGECDEAEWQQADNHYTDAYAALCAALDALSAAQDATKG